MISITSSEAERELFFERLEQCADSTFHDPLVRDEWILAVVEAVNNAAEHGNKGVEDRKIQIIMAEGAGVALCSVQDEGGGYTPKFGDLKAVSGSRGRGMSMIRASVDVLYHNVSGNRVTMIKGAESMRYEDNDISACIIDLGNGNRLASGLEFRGGKIRMTHGMGALMEHILNDGATRVWIDMTGVNILTSTAWGGLFADAEKEVVELIVLLNTTPSLMQTARLMELGKGDGPSGKIRVFGADDSEGTELLAKSIAASI